MQLALVDSSVFGLCFSACLYYDINESTFMGKILGPLLTNVLAMLSGQVKEVPWLGHNFLSPSILPCRWTNEPLGGYPH